MKPKFFWGLHFLISCQLTGCQLRETNSFGVIKKNAALQSSFWYMRFLHIQRESVICLQESYVSPNISSPRWLVLNIPFILYISADFMIFCWLKKKVFWKRQYIVSISTFKRHLEHFLSGNEPFNSPCILTVSLV